MATSHDQQITKFTNCLLAIDGALVPADLWVSATTGKILSPQSSFYSSLSTPSLIHDLGGRILSPGFLEVQLNGCFGVDYSVPRPDYASALAAANRKLVQTGVTSYLPTVTSQPKEVYPQVLPHLGPRKSRNALDGAESLGAHCEGPFINPKRSGIHNKEALRKPTSIAALEDVYGAENLNPTESSPPRIKVVTFASELDSSHRIVRELKARGIIPSIGHSAASYAEMSVAVKLGASMITHMFNAMLQPHHRDPGIFGILGAQEKKRPFFGIIADNIHVHPSMVRVAYNAFPEGCILVTDSMHVLGLPDGEYPWPAGDIGAITKKGGALMLKGTDRIAGSCVMLLECVVNLCRWAQVDVAVALQAVTGTPARMLGCEGVKGSLRPGADADLCVLEEGRDEQGRVTLKVEEVWKFGVQVSGKWEEKPVPKTPMARL